jgi:hypothetical protein
VSAHSVVNGFGTLGVLNCSFYSVLPVGVTNHNVSEVGFTSFLR